MTTSLQRRYPVGIQTFSEIIKGGYVYIDKTDLVWHLTRMSNYVFLSRPRRFGKSLLTTTLASYFRGEKDLFEGLKMMDLEKEWKQYPVIRLDLSVAKGQETASALRDRLLLLLKPYKEVYGSDPEEKTPGGVLMGLIARAFRKTGKQVVVLLDEYDSPLLETLHEGEMLNAMRKVMQEFYQPLKASEEMIKFCFITGITKFSQLSIFSTINNLKNVTMLPRFSAICGITEQELKSVFKEDISQIASVYDCGEEEMFQKIKLHYDGYHFASVSEDIYNPFSLLNAFGDGELKNYWFESGTPTFLIRQLQHFHTDITVMDDMEEPVDAFNVPTEAMTTALPLLYQSGYLTIKGYDREGEVYRLSIPNQEVRVGYTKGLLPTYIGLESANVQTGFALKFWRALKRGDVELAMREMQAYMAGIPYVEGFKKKLAEAATAEGFYEYTMYLIFSMLNVYARTQVKCAKGRSDIVVWMPDAIYVMELKVNDTAESALRQIDEKGYAKPFATDGCKIVKVGIKFSPETMTVEGWTIDTGVAAKVARSVEA